MSRCFWGQGPEFILFSHMCLFKKHGDLGLVFCEVVGFAIPENNNQFKKKGQAETCPYPQKEGK